MSRNKTWVEQLGLEISDQGDIKVNAPLIETSVPAVFAKGDCATPMKSASYAIAMGGLSAVGAVAQLEEVEGLGQKSRLFKCQLEFDDLGEICAWNTARRGQDIH